MFFIFIPFIIIAALLFSIRFYAGICRKMDLIAKDIAQYGEPRQKVIYFDSGRRNTELDSVSGSSLDYLFWKAPKKDRYPELYKNPHFYAGWVAYKAYRRFYLVGFIILLLFAMFAILAIIFATFFMGDPYKPPILK